MHALKDVRETLGGMWAQLNHHQTLEIMDRSVQFNMIKSPWDRCSFKTNFGRSTPASATSRVVAGQQGKKNKLGIRTNALPHCHMARGDDEASSPRNQ